MKRLIAGLIGAVSAGNGVLMLAAGRQWYAQTPGVAETGPFNPHFVADVGAAYLVAALSLLARALRPDLWPAAVSGALFFAAHALIHVAGILGGGSHHAAFETGLVIIPAALALYAAFPSSKEKRHA